MYKNYKTKKTKETLIESIDKSLSDAKKKFRILKEQYISTPIERSQPGKVNKERQNHARPL